MAKVKCGVLYEPSYSIPSYLYNQGITSVIAPLTTKNNSLWIQIENRTVVVYPFIDGDSSWTGMTDEQCNVFIVDWDEVMMAPKERDFIFLNEGSFYGLAGDSITPFIQGYGHTEIDWLMLTYYKFERAIQDLIAYTEEVLFKDDSAGKKKKADVLQAFNELFEGGGEISAAYSAAKHLHRLYDIQL